VKFPRRWRVSDTGGRPAIRLQTNEPTGDMRAPILVAAVNGHGLKQKR
jgi:hypothetical protein